MIVGDKHTMTADMQRIASTSNPCRVLTIRLSTGSSDIFFGDSTGKIFGYLNADESWTWGPNAGTIDPYDLYVKGTAGDIMYWSGIPV